jgi:hypothetical protein
MSEWCAFFLRFPHLNLTYLTLLAPKIFLGRIRRLDQTWLVSRSAVIHSVKPQLVHSKTK